MASILMNKAEMDVLAEYRDKYEGLPGFSTDYASVADVEDMEEAVELFKTILMDPACAPDDDMGAFSFGTLPGIQDWDNATTDQQDFLFQLKLDEEEAAGKVWTSRDDSSYTDEERLEIAIRSMQDYHRMLDEDRSAGRIKHIIQGKNKRK